MADLIITDLSGNSELLTDYKEMVRKRRVNGERSLSFLLLKNDRNTHSFDLVQEESKVTYDGDDYRIKSIEERLIGTTPVKQINAEHVFFDIIDTYQYTTLSNGSKTISQALSFALANTGYTFSVIDSFGTVTFEKFGNDTALALFQKILERYAAEFDIVGTDIKIYTKIGSSPDFQFRYKYNIKTFSRTVRTDNLSTYIKGYGKVNDDGTYVAEAEYTSPMSATYGVRDAKPVYDERFTDAQSLEDYIKTKIIDTPEISLTLDFVDLQKAGYPTSYPKLGDTVPLIYEPLNVDLETRILDIEDYPESNKSAKVTLANFNEEFADVMFRHTKDQLDKIYDENAGKIRFNVLDEAVKLATEALNNSLTELEYPEGMGILARDPNDPNRFTVFRSAGIGITTDGGVTFPNAITPDGINTALLVAGQIKTNNIQIIGEDNLFYWDGNYLIAIDPVDPNKFVRLDSGELYISGGAITINGGLPDSEIENSGTWNTQGTYIDSNGVYTGTVRAENINGAQIDTSNFDGTGDYLKMHKQFAEFIEDGTGNTKLKLGFVWDGTKNVPALFLGAGDINGNNTAYISKDSDSVNFVYDFDATTQTYLKLFSDHVLANKTFKTGYAETARCGVGGVDGLGGTTAVAGVAVNFRMKKTYIPSSINLTESSSNVSGNENAIAIDENGFWFYIDGDGTTGYKFWRGNYTA